MGISEMYSVSLIIFVRQVQQIHFCLHECLEVCSRHARGLSQAEQALDAGADVLLHAHFVSGLARRFSLQSGHGVRMVGRGGVGTWVAQSSGGVFTRCVALGVPVGAGHVCRVGAAHLSSQ